MIPGFRTKIERKVIESEADLEKERMAFAPVLGKDPWYACLSYAIFRLLTLHIFTPSGVWVATTTPLAFWITERALLQGQLPTGGWWTVGGFGAHTILAWIYFCERHGARKIIAELANLVSAAADYVRGRNKPQSAQGDEK